MESEKNLGTFTEVSCPRLLARLHQTRFDGTLRISSGARLKLLFFREGEIAMASSNDQEDHLAPILIRAGKLKPEQMELARKSSKPGASLARILVQMGFLTSGELFAGARQQLRQIVRSVLILTDAKYEIQSGYFPREITSLNVDTREMLLELIRDLSDRSFVLLEVGAPDTVYAHTERSGNGREGAKLPRSWKEYAERFASPLTIRDFGQATGLDDFAASKVVYGLSLLECVEPRVQEELPPANLSEASRISLSIAPETPEVELGEGIGEGFKAPPPLPVEMEKTPEPLANFHERFHPSEPAVSVAETPEPPAATSLFEARVEAEPNVATPQPASETIKAAGEVRVVREGPTRAEIKGPFESSLPVVKPLRSWVAVSVFGGLSLLALASYWFIFLRQPAPGNPQPPSPPAGEKTAAKAEPESGSTPASDAGNQGLSAQTTGPGDAMPAPTQENDNDASRGKADSTRQQGKIPPSGTEPATASEPPPAPSIAAPAVSSPLSDARARLDAGEFASAAKAWADALRPGGAGSFTLQIAIACQEESLQKAATRTRGADRFFALPFSLQGRSCYRLCWGTYSTLDEAQAAKPSIPAFFLEEGGRPVVVSLQRALSPEGR